MTQCCSIVILFLIKKKEILTQSKVNVTVTAITINAKLMTL